MREIRCPASGRVLRLRRAWPRPSGHLLLEYTDGDESVAGQWFADRGRLRTVARQTDAVAPGAVSCDDEAGVMLQRRGVDRRLPALAGIVADEDAALVVHRPERRAVVRRARPGATTYLKVVRPGRALPGTVALPGVRVPEVLAADPARGSVEYAELVGQTLHDLLGAAGRQHDEIAVAPAFHAAGEMVRALHSSPFPPGLSAHRPDDEVAVTTRWLDHAFAHAVLGGNTRAAAADALTVLAREVAALALPISPALLHRDLHDKQVLVAGADDAGLLDLDTLAAGDPALDVANLLVHLELRALQGHCPAEAAGAAGDAFLTGYGPDRALQERLRAYVVATRLRLACVYAFRPRWHHLAAELVGSARKRTTWVSE